MYHDLLRHASFWSFLFDVDKDLAGKTREKACPCGGRLHCANYLRKPQGGPKDLPKEYRYRLSFCCDRDGCRKRVTPPSVRFFGRKVYLGAVVVLVAAMRQGATPRRVCQLSEWFDVDPRTISRWQVFWREHFPQTPFWKVERGRLVPTVCLLAIPRSLLEAFVHSEDDREGWKKLLLFLSPITITDGLKIKVSKGVKWPRRRCRRRS